MGLWRFFPSFIFIKLFEANDRLTYTVLESLVKGSYGGSFLLSFSENDAMTLLYVAGCNMRSLSRDYMTLVQRETTCRVMLNVHNTAD